jgi:hypothetical protein
MPPKPKIRTKQVATGGKVLKKNLATKSARKAPRKTLAKKAAKVVQKRRYKPGSMLSQSFITYRY